VNTLIMIKEAILISKNKYFVLYEQRIDKIYVRHIRVWKLSNEPLDITADATFRINNSRYQIDGEYIKKDIKDDKIYLW